MPYVPAGFPAGFYQHYYPARYTRYYAGSFFDTGDYSATIQNRGAIKVGVKGKKVQYPWGWWSPVRAYQRSAILVEMVGTTETVQHKEIPLKTVYDGLPGFYPSSFMAFQYYGALPIDLGGVPSPVPFNTRNRLITECILKIGDRKASIGEFLAESGKAIDHLAHTSISLLKALLAMRRGNMSGVARALGVSFKSLKSGETQAKRWLEYQYAWLPLINDIYDLAGVAKNGLGKKPPLLSAVRNLSDSAPWESNFVGGGNTYADIKGTMHINHRCKLWYRLDDSTLYRLNQLELINPAEIAWELLPYSFVIDWFLPVGNVLSAWSATWGLTYVDGVITSRAQGSAGGLNRVLSDVNRLAGGYTWLVDQTGIRREAVSSPSPFLYFKSPFSTTHVVSALALLRQLRK